MVCLDNSTHYLSVVAYSNFLAYCLICLPQYTQVSKLVASLNFSVLALTAYTAIAPNYVPGSTLPLLTLDASFLLLFYLLFDAAGTILFVYAAVVFFGPILLVTREHVQSFTEQQFGFQPSDFALGIIGLALIIVTVYLYSAAQRNRAFESVLVSAVYSALCAIGIRYVYIQIHHSSSEYCCGEDYEDNQCPILFNWLFVVLFVTLAVGRLAAIYVLRPCIKSTPIVPTVSPQRQVEHASEYQPVELASPTAQPLIEPRRRFDLFY